MKTFLYLNTVSWQNAEVTTFIECLNGMLSQTSAEPINIDLSLFEIERQRLRRPLFAFRYEDDSMKVGSLYSWDELASYAKDGYKVVQVDDCMSFFRTVCVGYKYYKYVPDAIKPNTAPVRDTRLTEHVLTSIVAAFPELDSDEALPGSEAVDRLAILWPTIKKAINEKA